jgi:RNA polymerase sigma-B factor
LDAPLPGADTEEQTLVDSLGKKDDGFALPEARLSVPLAIARLPYLERRAVILRLTQNLTQVEIAPEMGCSRMQVSRLLRRRQLAFAAYWVTNWTPGMPPKGS